MALYVNSARRLLVVFTVEKDTLGYTTTMQCTSELIPMANNALPC